MGRLLGKRQQRKLLSLGIGLLIVAVQLLPKNRAGYIRPLPLYSKPSLAHIK